MFNLNFQTILIETVVYIVINICIKFILISDDLTKFRRTLMLGYFVFASFFVSLKIFLTVSALVIILAFGIRKFFDF
ncbi:MAG: hypothetical protein C0174_06880 [Thermodesulfobium narugense]|nr:MAG: hypothetical protein C0174_06880 [Thermodesulfobium narugense]